MNVSLVYLQPDLSGVAWLVMLTATLTALWLMRSELSQPAVHVRLSVGVVVALLLVVPLYAQPILVQCDGWVYWLVNGCWWY